MLRGFEESLGLGSVAICLCCFRRALVRVGTCVCGRICCVLLRWLLCLRLKLTHEVGVCAGIKILNHRGEAIDFLDLHRAQSEYGEFRVKELDLFLHVRDGFGLSGRCLPPGLAANSSPGFAGAFRFAGDAGCTLPSIVVAAAAASAGAPFWSAAVFVNSIFGVMTLRDP